MLSTGQKEYKFAIFFSTNPKLLLGKAVEEFHEGAELCFSAHVPVDSVIYSGQGGLDIRIKVILRSIHERVRSGHPVASVTHAYLCSHAHLRQLESGRAFGSRLVQGPWTGTGDLTFWLHCRALRCHRTSVAGVEEVSENRNLATKKAA